MVKSVVLVNPPLQLQDRYGKDMKHFGGVAEPLGLAYIASYLESKNINVRIIDSQADTLTLDEVVRNIIEHGDDVVGITMLTPMYGVVKQLCETLKRDYAHGTIVLGGVHCTALPERTLQEISEADIVCIGEGEITLAEIVLSADHELGHIRGICFRQGEKLIKTGHREFLNELDALPPPARHMLPIKKYHLTASRVGESAYCPTIIVARGCPFSCSYCSHPLGKHFRTHGVKRILHEIHDLIEHYDVFQINIEADTLTVNNEFLNSLCNALIESGLHQRVQWTCESRIDTVNEEILELMRRAGYWQISYGVETGSQRLLDRIHKSIQLVDIERVFLMTQKIGIAIRGFFMLGLPTETKEESLMTIAFAKKLNPLWAQFTLTIPYPGTPMFEELSKNGFIRTYDWRLYNTWSGWRGTIELPYVPEGRSVEELVSLQKYAMRSFYFRPKVFWRFIRRVRSVNTFKKYIMGLWVLIKSKVL